eukprot:CAMPEP_0179256594 /NCGR_PEP_ID=MMETSP0797-20121207/24350_1 /TAXON_ID=47934 /ORGANISM="Dinophysis acuminata, Strain DAEP01" /LENGTH=333 /DNA_ID=CAMNT_0020964539 /DNA_START=214 /DNA_END=1212 /DNA_ORIENTATION=+
MVLAEELGENQVHTALRHPIRRRCGRRGVGPARRHDDVAVAAVAAAGAEQGGPPHEVEAPRKGPARRPDREVHARHVLELERDGAGLLLGCQEQRVLGVVVEVALLGGREGGAPVLVLCHLDLSVVGQNVAVEIRNGDELSGLPVGARVQVEKSEVGSHPDRLLGLRVYGQREVNGLAGLQEDLRELPVQAVELFRVVLRVLAEGVELDPHRPRPAVGCLVAREDDTLGAVVGPPPAEVVVGHHLKVEVREVGARVVVGLLLVYAFQKVRYGEQLGRGRLVVVVAADAGEEDGAHGRQEQDRPLLGSCAGIAPAPGGGLGPGAGVGFCAGSLE